MTQKILKIKGGSMGLFNLFKKKNTTKKTVKRTTQVQNMNRLDKDGNLPYGWATVNRAFCEKINSEFTYFLNAWIKSKNQEPLKQYEALKSFVLWLNDARKLCNIKGQCFGRWFTSTIADNIYIAKREAELAELEKDFDSIESAWKTRQKELPNLDGKIKKLLKEHDGILQSEFVKMFDQSVQNEVKEKLYYMDKAGKLQRTKQGRSYALHLK